jgi:hypothetical protein
MNNGISNLAGSTSMGWSTLPTEYRSSRHYFGIPSRKLLANKTSKMPPISRIQLTLSPIARVFSRMCGSNQHERGENDESTQSQAGRMRHVMSHHCDCDTSGHGGHAQAHDEQFLDHSAVFIPSLVERGHPTRFGERRLKILTPSANMHARSIRHTAHSNNAR